MIARLALVAASVVAAVVLPAPPAAAEGRPPRLERFVARYNPATTTTFYIAVAGDPDGGKLSYRWSLTAECGYLTDPETTGPSQGFQHGPPARKPDGCTNEQDRKAKITLRITDPEGCTIVYTQGARDETEHVAPQVQAGPCPPGDEPPPQAGGESPPAEGRSFPLLAVILGAGVVAGLAMLATRLRRPVPDAPEWERPAETAMEEEPLLVPPAPGEPARRRGVERERVDAASEPPRRKFEPRPSEPEPSDAEPEPSYDPEPSYRDPTGVFASPDAPPAAAEAEDVFSRRSSSDVLPTIRASEPIVDDVPSFLEDDDEDLPSLFAEDPAAPEIPPTGAAKPPCREGSVRKLDNDFVAHDTLLAGTVRARALRSGNTVDVPPDDPAEILRLAAGMSDEAPLEVEVEIPLRLVTVVSSRREVCRGGTWIPEVETATHDGPPRVERLRAIVTGPDDLERFAREILAKRLRTLSAARRRLDAALDAMRGRG